MTGSHTARVSLGGIAFCTMVALGLAGCSGDHAPAASEAEDGPLAEYIYALWGNDGFSQATLDAELKKSEELVAKCMSEAGFDYVPNSQQGGAVLSETDGENDMNSDDFIKQYGYGIANSPGLNSTSSDKNETVINPNDEFFESLSDSEQKAYDEALWGSTPTEAELEASGGEDPEEYDWKTAGCQGSAQHEARQASSTIDTAMKDPAYAELFTEVQDFYKKLYDDEAPNSEISALYRSWSDCMAQDGYVEYPRPSVAMQKLQNEFSQLYVSGESQEESQQPSKADRAAFSEREITIALADKKCRESLDYDTKIKQAQNAFEQEFVDKHQQQLDALVTTYGKKKSK